ncbi:hypothetical protein J5N97_016974 [Dioscorea zingiberensis]|uniref:Uncharacterized protein n=1 Tax=Dioscorea zingiberensis TaxID=325984 RepID=A0A9D5CLD9_9LILI|nr:hypothetical protein J5N97_016974 [Dioscorea zingiberensis]
MNSSSIEINAPNEKEDNEPLISEINIRKVAAEFIGTYILIFIGVGSILVDQRVQITLLGVALAWGTAVTALVYAIGHISGCHLNPAITVAFASLHQFPWKMVIPYAVSQVLGATLACLTLLCLFAGEHATSVMQSHPIGSTSNLSAVASEIMVTFILMFVTCGSVTDAMAAKDLAGVAIGYPRSPLALCVAGEYFAYQQVCINSDLAQERIIRSNHIRSHNIAPKGVLL